MHVIDRGVQARRIAALKNAIEEGMNRGEAVDFDPAAHLKSLKASRRNA